VPAVSRHAWTETVAEICEDWWKPSHRLRRQIHGHIQTQYSRTTEV